jgi:hypothetical protein
LSDAQVSEGEEKKLPKLLGCFECDITTHFTHFAILMRAPLKLSHLISRLIIGNIKAFLRNLENL